MCGTLLRNSTSRLSATLRDSSRVKFADIIIIPFKKLDLRLRLATSKTLSLIHYQSMIAADCSSAGHKEYLLYGIIVDT